MLLVRTTAPAVEVVSLAEAKAHLRVLHDSEDTEIARFVRVARDHVERTLSRALVTQTFTLYMPAFPGRDRRTGLSRIILPRPPLQSVTHVKYRDVDGVEQTLSASSYHVLAEDELEGCVEKAASVTWPSTDKHPRAVEVRYVAGYGAAASDVPEPIRNAVLMLAEHLYFNRGETSDGALSKNPVAAEALLAPYAIHGWI